MKPLILSISVLLTGLSLSAQGTFRIFDAQMNDVTNGIIYLPDTNAAQILCDLTVENTDSITHNVTAGRMVLTGPVGATNAFIWGPTQYPPSADSSVVDEYIAPAAMQTFQGLYFPNGNAGSSTINYCFWERTDMNNYSCVTVTFDNYVALNVGAPVSHPFVMHAPYPGSEIIGVGWNGHSYDVVNLYSSDGKIIESRNVRGQYGCEFNITNRPSGIYMISCVSEEGEMYNTKFVH